MSSSSEWMQFYQQQQQQEQHQQHSFSIIQPQTTTLHDGATDSTVVTTTVTTPNAQTDSRASTRPIRRRTRASRRTPTTLLNTDTSNFRAMVQQFTGGPSGGNPGFSFGLGTAQQMMNTNAPGFVPGYHVQFQRQQVAPPQYPYNQHQQMMIGEIQGGGFSDHGRGGGSAHAPAGPRESSSNENKHHNYML